MFKKRFTFRPRRGEEPDEDAADPSGSSNTLAPARASAISLRSPSPSRSISQGSIDQQFRKTSLSSLDKDAPAQDPLGLKVVHRPPGERRVDIIFVHGLGGSSQATWCKNRDQDIFWPLLFLPSEPGLSDARIMTFGYNSNFQPGSSKNKTSILDFSKELLFDMKYGRDDTLEEHEELGLGTKPIIFVVHSMGGLLVKEAYMLGQNDPTYESIIKAVSAIIFLSTPHRGTNLAEILNRILQVSFVASPMQFISELATGSQTLQKLNEQFRHVAPKLDIVSFYETRPTSMMNVVRKTKIMVLEKDSSMLGYPGEISKPLDADHHEVCKYGSRDDPSYITVRNALMALTSRIKSKGTVDTQAGGQPGSDAAAQASFEEYLSVPETPESDYNFFRDRWTFGTCTWILDHSAFRSFAEDHSHEPRVLWIHGNAASGKSILSSFIIDCLIQLGHPCSYFFIRFTDQKKRAWSRILRSLSCQLARSLPEYGDKIRRLEAAATDLKTADARNAWQWLFKQALFQLDILEPLFIVIDGVDEAESPGTISRLLADLHLARIPLRVLLVSRKTQEISSGFQRLERQVRVESIPVEGNQDDIKSYIKNEMDIAGDEVYRDEVTSQLLQRAQGNFLWTHLAVQKINTCHTKLSVENALQDLPTGMGALYDRMATTVKSQANASDGRLGMSILGWTTCSRRVLTVSELSDALDNTHLLEIQRTIGDLCGGFVVVDVEGNVSMIHETAREYLTRGGPENQAVVINPKATNDTLLLRCIRRLTDNGLRSRINRNQPPALLDYAVRSWHIHLSQGTVSEFEILDTVVKFLQGPHVLNWIFAAATNKELRVLVVASRHLADVALKLRRRGSDSFSVARSIDTLERWATDLTKIVGKFGGNLVQRPDSIFKLIPPFCPASSIIYEQFGHKEARALRVSGFTNTVWDDCLARFSLDPGMVASVVIPAGSRIAVLANIKKTGTIILYDAATFEELRRLTHPERVLDIAASKFGDHLLSYGYQTTRVWEAATGKCKKVVNNPPKRPRPRTLAFSEDSKTIIAGSENRYIWTAGLDEAADPNWVLHSSIDEESLDGTTVRFPVCSALSPDGTMIAYGYRAHPVTVWELEPQMLLGQCQWLLDDTDRTVQESTWGEVFKLAWHPFSGEVFGLTQVGLLFKWDPCEEYASVKAHTGANSLTISRDGALVATGDGVGTLKIFQSIDLTLLYQLSAQDPVLYLSFSSDSRRVYDIRGSYGNVWEPNTLVRLAERSEYPEHNSDTSSETESLARVSQHAEHYIPRVDSVITLSGQSVSQLYSYGTEGGVATLCEVGKGKVCDMERQKGFMSMEKMAWSDDGRYVAFSDLSGILFIKRVSRSTKSPGGWELSEEFSLAIPPQQGHIKKLLFHPGGGSILVITGRSLNAVGISDRRLTLSVPFEPEAAAEWISHPTCPDYFLGFSNTIVHAFTWEGLKAVASYAYSIPVMGRHAVGRLISSSDSPYIFLQVSFQTPLGKMESQYVLFRVVEIEPISEQPSVTDITCSTLPSEISSRINEPLAFMSRRRLIFLDTDRWICSWSPPPPQPAGQIIAPIERYYFLPGDWVAAHETKLCSILPDGTFLCPRNGDVVAVQCSRLRK